MSTRPKKAEPRPAPRLYLITPPVAETGAFAASLAEALAAGDVAAVLLRLADADERSLINCAKALGPVVQDKGAALLLDGHVELVARAGADGAHLTGLAAFTDALAHLKPDRIAGAGGLASRARRHDRRRGRRRLRHVRRAGCRGRAAVLRRDRRPHRLVGGGVRDPLRRLCRVSGRGRAAGESRRRFHRARRLALARPPQVIASAEAAAHLRLPETAA